MKKIISLTLTTIMIGMAITSANEQADNLLDRQPDNQRLELEKPEIEIITTTATASSTNMLVNDAKISVDAYMIDNSNYIKLRDLAFMANNTDKNFEISWNQENQAIEITSNTQYTVVGGEMTLGNGSTQTATTSTSDIYINGRLAPLTAYKIGENNYFKLRDIMQIFDVYIVWDQDTLTATLETSKSYELSDGEGILNFSQEQRPDGLDQRPDELEPRA